MQFGMHGPPAVFTEEDRHGQRVSLQPTSIRYCAPSVQESRGYLPTVNQAGMICCIWLPPPAVSTRRAQSTAPPCHEPKMPHPDIRCSGIIPWLPKPAITQLPTHLVTVSPASTSLIHCTTPGSQTIHLPSLSYSYLGQPVGSSCQSHTVPVSPVGLLKITPESRTFQNIIYEPHVRVEENSINKAQIKSTNLDRLSPVQVRISEYAGKGTVDGNGEKSGPASNFGLAIRKAPRLRLLG
ncbi:hypothetical protein GEV33_014438 [Tenebrio molitor]|uniref:Uncharacterized protein n=1 Tax=Tenebrio molitor TaxID=7067 RepID=A0A8J6H6U7_TENMO|nr:hypothetical protein GEV33_014438 [Tenebrio molitor]